jgi:hypothetical protein
VEARLEFLAPGRSVLQLHCRGGLSALKILQLAGYWTQLCLHFLLVIVSSPLDIVASVGGASNATKTAPDRSSCVFEMAIGAVSAHSHRAKTASQIGAPAGPRGRPRASVVPLENESRK